MTTSSGFQAIEHFERVLERSAELHGPFSEAAFGALHRGIDDVAVAHGLHGVTRYERDVPAGARLDDILGSETRTAVATHDLVEIIRVTKGRKPVRDEELEKTGTVLPTTIPDIEYGRGEIEKQITERTRQKIADFGIELLDERFKRSKYNPAVAEKIIERMSSERHQIAARFRSEGRGEAANISGQKESDVASISSNATKIALETEGKADAEAAAIYAAAFGAPDEQELYSFLRSLDVMRAAFEKDTTAVLSTNSDLGRMLKSMAEAVAPKIPPH